MSNTPNFSLPLLHSAQAQKELTHNEALVLIDALLHGSVVAQANDPTPLAPMPGQGWIVGSAPLAEWAGKSGQIAVYSEGGWRFAPAVDGMRLLDRAAGVIRRHDGSDWVVPAGIEDPSGGGTVDAEARVTLSNVLTALRLAGLVAVT